MYETQFGFSGPPFQLNPDPSFLFESTNHSRALSYLRYGVQQGEGFIVITGDIGAGKTTLVRALLQQLDSEEVVAAHLANTQLESSELLHCILTAFGVPAQGLGKGGMIANLEAFLTGIAASGRRALLVVDEAQNLSAQALEELRMLSNFQLGSHALLQSFLIGQPELRLLLQGHAMEQLRQRILASYHLGPLSLEETAGYVRHRLQHVGWRGDPPFDDYAFAALHERTGGVPRRINLLCNRILLAAYLSGAEGITHDLVRQTADELSGELQIPTLPQTQSVAMNAESASAAPAPEPMPVLEPVPVPPAPVAWPAAVPDVTLGDAVLTAPVLGMPLPTQETPPSPEPLPDQHLGSDVLPEPRHRAARPDVAVTTTPGREVTPLEQVEPLILGLNLDLQPAAQSDSGVLPRLPQPLPMRTPVDTSSAGFGAGHVAPLTAVTGAERPDGLRKSSHRRSTVIALSDSAMGFAKLHRIAQRWQQEKPGGEFLCAHVGSEQALEQDDWLPVVNGSQQYPALQISPEPAEAVLASVKDLLELHEPQAIVALGHGWSMLYAVLAARQAGVPVVRLEAGGLRGDAETDTSVLSTLIDRASVWLCCSGLREQQALAGEGFQAHRMARVGSLASAVLQHLAPRVPDPRQVLAKCGLPPSWLARAATGFGLITAQLSCDDVPMEDALQWLMLARLGHAEVPMLWLAEPATAQALRDPSLRLHVESSGIAVVTQRSALERIALLTQARCLLASTARMLVDEAVALAVPVVQIALYANVPSTLEDGGLIQVGPSAAQLRSAVRAAYQRHAASGHPHDLDDDAAIEIAQQLARWLSQRELGAAAFEEAVA